MGPKGPNGPRMDPRAPNGPQDPEWVAFEIRCNISVTYRMQDPGSRMPMQDPGSRLTIQGLGPWGLLYPFIWGPFGAHFIWGAFGPYSGPRCYPRLGGLLVIVDDMLSDECACDCLGQK